MKEESKAPKLFSFGVSLLVTIAASVVIIGHAFNVLTDISILVAVVSSAGPLLVDWVQYASSWWSTNEKHDKGVIFTSYGVSVVLLFVMLGSGGLVVADYAFRQAETVQVGQQFDKAKSDASLKQSEDDAIKRRELEDERQFGQTVAQWKAAGFSETFIRQRMRERARAQLSAQAPLFFAPAMPKIEQPDGAQAPIERRFMRLVHQYATIWVFILPPLAAAVGYALLKLVLIWPGGAGLAATSDGRPALSTDETTDDPKESPRP